MEILEFLLELVVTVAYEIFVGICQGSEIDR